MRRISCLTMAVVMFASFVIMGCKVNAKTDALGNMLGNEVDSDILSLDRYSQRNGCLEYGFLLKSYNTEGLGDDIRQIYDNANKFLAHGAAKSAG